MNTAILALPSSATEAELRRADAAAGWAETEPACWRSEAFAEDLADLLLPSAGYGRRQAEPAAPPDQSARPLLRRALALVLRR